MFCATPDSAEPARNTRIAARSSPLRPNRSLTLPQIGVNAAAARTYTVTTQVSWLSPPSSPAIVGSAVAMIVWSSAATNIVSSRPPKTSRTARASGVTSGSAGLRTCSICFVMSRLPSLCGEYSSG